MKNILKTVLPVIAIFSAFSLHNTYAESLEYYVNELNESFNEFAFATQNNKELQELAERVKDIVNSINQSSFNIKNLDGLDTELKYLHTLLYKNRNNKEVYNKFKPLVEKFSELLNILEKLYNKDYIELPEDISNAYNTLVNDLYLCHKFSNNDVLWNKIMDVIIQIKQWQNYLHEYGNTFEKVQSQLTEKYVQILYLSDKVHADIKSVRNELEVPDNILDNQLINFIDNINQNTEKVVKYLINKAQNELKQ